ncbi:hypothetical protein HANVADRAFT_61727 [Hanseniaspora valbyensis NRRL Y-1626]|uniref:Uncharacterized protein n=1 Tax=Hanseniaspora valbyensis NRRL Y-1626 TaxID=766949 RepID=A0A1B7TGZ2_9ASCO|nr:hypothetical protein HANVADRAFT_61727 [Hanseniaspora valbyensis NRRL Y-1626]
MSAENDLKNEINENKQYIAALLARGDQQEERVRYMEEFSNTQSAIIEGLKKKVVKYTKLYTNSLERIEQLEKENKQNVDEVWKLRGENELLKQKLELETQSFKDKIKSFEENNNNKEDKGKTSLYVEEIEKLKRENADLKQNIEVFISNGKDTQNSNDFLLIEQINALKDEINGFKETLATEVKERKHSDKFNDASSINLEAPEDDTAFLLRSSSNHSRPLLNKKIRNTSVTPTSKMKRYNSNNSEFDRFPTIIDNDDKEIKEIIDTNVGKKESESEIEELEQVLQKYKSRFDAEDAKKKRFQEVFTLFDVVKTRLSSELLNTTDNRNEIKVENTPKELKKDIDLAKYEQLESKIEQISKNLESLMQQKTRASPKQRSKSEISNNNNRRYSTLDKGRKIDLESNRNSLKVNFDDVSIDESQIDILHRNVGETTQRKYSLETRYEDNHSNNNNKVISRNSSNGSSRTLKTAGSDAVMSNKHNEIDENVNRFNSSTPPSTKKTGGLKEHIEINATDITNGSNSAKHSDTLERIVRETKNGKMDVDDIVARYA